MSVVTYFLDHTPFLRDQRAKLFRRYVLPVSTVITALAINWLVAPYVSILPPFLTFVAAIMVTAWYGGFAAAVFAIVFSTCIINYYFIPPISGLTLNLGDLGTLGFFTLEALLMAYCIDYLRQNQNNLRRANLELERQVVSKHREVSDQEERLRGLMYQLATTEERERRQLAVELHDYLAQLLTLARMKNKQAQQQVFHSLQEATRFMEETDGLLRTSIEYVRTLMAELYPAQLHELGLPAALRWLAGQMPRHGLAVQVSIPSEAISIPNDIALLLYHSVRELLMNIVKHAGVNQAFVSLNVNVACVCLTVMDTGRGFDPSEVPGSSPGQCFGLQNVRDRIATVGGTFVIESSIGKGTSVALTLPLETLTESSLLRAASAVQQERVRTIPAVPPNQQSLPL